jgi:hypothetical protein
MRLVAHAPFTVWPNCSEYMPMITWRSQTFLTSIQNSMQGAKLLQVSNLYLRHYSGILSVRRNSLPTSNSAKFANDSLLAKAVAAACSW